MAFNDKQYFYAALWWAAALPGGGRHIESVCIEKGFVMPSYRVREAQGDKVDASQCHEIVESIYTQLRTNQALISVVADGSGARYIEMGDVTSRALQACGLAANLLEDHARMSLHEDGQILVNTRWGQKVKTLSPDYPGKQETEHRLVNFSAENFAQRANIAVAFNGCDATVPYIEVTAPLQIGQGSDYEVAAPGDKIVWDGRKASLVRQGSGATGEIKPSLRPL